VFFEREPFGILPKEMNEIHVRARSTMRGGIYTENEEHTKITSSDKVCDYIQIRLRVHE
jgi:hypothetical protein